MSDDSTPTVHEALIYVMPRWSLIDAVLMATLSDETLMKHASLGMNKVVWEKEGVQFHIREVAEKHRYIEEQGLESFVDFDFQSYVDTAFVLKNMHNQNWITEDERHHAQAFLSMAKAQNLTDIKYNAAVSFAVLAFVAVLTLIFIDF